MKIVAMNHSRNINPVNSILFESVVKTRSKSPSALNSISDTSIDIYDFCKWSLLASVLLSPFTMVETANADNNNNNKFNTASKQLAKTSMKRYGSSTRFGLSRVNSLSNLDNFRFNGILLGVSKIPKVETPLIRKIDLNSTSLLNSTANNKKPKSFINVSLNTSLKGSSRQTDYTKNALGSVNKKTDGQYRILKNKTELLTKATTNKTITNKTTTSNNLNIMTDTSSEGILKHSQRGHLQKKDVQKNSEQQKISAISSLAVKSGTDGFIPVDFASINIKKHELATMQVLSEVCPKFLKKSQYEKFNKGFNTQLHELMPNVKNPKIAMKYLSNQQDYKKILVSMKSWNLSFTDDENMKMCQDVVNYK